MKYEEMDVNTINREKISKAKDLTIELSEGRESPYYRLA